jgi:hypothetical protein
VCVACALETSKRDGLNEDKYTVGKYGDEINIMRCQIVLKNQII